jgi:hypothetical protein
MQDDVKLEHVWRIARMSGANARWYWETRNHFGAVLQQSAMMFEDLRQCLADAERAGFGGQYSA